MTVTIDKDRKPPAPVAIRRRRGVGQYGWLFLIPALIGVCALVYAPLVATVWQSTKGVKPGFGGGEIFVGLGNYERMLKDGSLAMLLRNSVIWTVAVVVGQNVFGFACALVMNRRWAMSGLLRAALVLPWVLPGVVAALLWKLMYDPQLGLIGSVLQRGFGLAPADTQFLARPQTALAAVIVAAIWKGFPFSFLIYLAALQTVDRDLIEAAVVDGAGRWAILTRVIIPSLRHVVLLTVLLTSIFTFNYFDMIWVATKGGPLDATHIFPTYIFQSGFGNFNFGLAAAYGVVAFLLLALLLVPYLRQTRRAEGER